MRFLQRYGWKNFLLWTCVALLDFAGDYFNDFIRDRPFYWSEELPFASSWYIWFLLAPPVAVLAQKWNFNGTYKWRPALLHAAVYVLINAVHILLTSLHILLVSRVFDQHHDFNNILYKIAVTGSFYNVVVYAAILIVTHSVLYRRELQDERLRVTHLLRAQAEQRLQFLTQQLQPHFLFNTHHSIITLMKMEKWREATSMMEKLSEMMRLNLRDDGKTTQPLLKEMHSLQLYVDIQRVRFGDKLEFASHIEENVKQAIVPTMILQPIVENSIRYAVERSPQAGKIKVRAFRRSQQLVLLIWDSGGNTGAESGFGIGLSNTKERLSTLYGENYSMEISQSTEAGTEVTISLPLLQNEMQRTDSR